MSRATISLLAACTASILLYAVSFGLVLQRPLAFGFLRQQIEAKLARGASIAGPKLVVLAGSNGPYSHRCEVIEPLLGRACVNAGVAVGIGLDYLFTRWDDVLHPGDVVYMPMELAQYVRSRLATEVGPDAAIMFRHDRNTLARLPPERWLGALFAFDLRAAVMSVVEPALSPLHLADQRAAVGGEMNPWGDHVGHTASLGLANQPMLRALVLTGTKASAIRAGYGTALIAAFVRRETARGVRVIGGLPTTFDDVALQADTLAAVRAVYEDNGGGFLLLANRSRYPRAEFFDSPDHLIEPAQILHSTLVAEGLAALLGPPPLREAAGLL